MKGNKHLRATAWASVLGMAPQAALACAACTGRSDSDMAVGANAGILVMMVILVGVLAGFAAFAIHLARRSARRTAPENQSLPSDS